MVAKYPGSVDGTNTTAIIGIVIDRRINFNPVDSIVQSYPNILLKISMYTEHRIILQPVALMNVLHQAALFIHDYYTFENGSKSIITIQYRYPIVKLCCPQ